MAHDEDLLAGLSFCIFAYLRSLWEGEGYLLRGAHHGGESQIKFAVVKGEYPKNMNSKAVEVFLTSHLTANYSTRWVFNSFLGWLHDWVSRGISSSNSHELATTSHCSRRHGMFSKSLIA